MYVGVWVRSLVEKLESLSHELGSLSDDLEDERQAHAATQDQLHDAQSELVDKCTEREAAQAEFERELGRMQDECAAVETELGDALLAKSNLSQELEKNLRTVKELREQLAKMREGNEAKVSAIFGEQAALSS